MKRKRDKDYIQFDTSENDEVVEKIKNDKEKQDTLAYYNEDMARAAAGRVFQGVNQEEIKKNQRQHTSHDVFDSNKNQEKDDRPTFSYTNEELDELNGITKTSEDFIMRDEDKPKNRKKQPYSYIDDAEELYRDYNTSNRSEIVDSFYGKQNVNYTNSRSRTSSKRGNTENQPYESKIRRESVYVNVQTANINRKKYDYDSKEKYDEDYVDNTPYEEKNDGRDYVLNYDQLPYSKTSTTGIVSKRYTENVKLPIEEDNQQKAQNELKQQQTDRLEKLKQNRNTATKMKPVIDSTGRIEIIGEKEENGVKAKQSVTTVRKKKNNSVAIVRVGVLACAVMFGFSTIYLLWNNNKYKSKLAEMTEQYNELATVKSNSALLESQIEELQNEINVLKGEVEGTQDDGSITVVDENTDTAQNGSELPTTYIVQSGDTLSKISKKFYDTPNQYMAIEQANNLTNGDLVVGQQLTIPKIQ